MAMDVRLDFITLPSHKIHALPQTINPKIQHMDLQVGKVINENLNLLKGIVYHYYTDIDE
jgi:hypothetical protein